MLVLIYLLKISFDIDGYLWLFKSENNNNKTFLSVLEYVAHKILISPFTPDLTLTFSVINDTISLNFLFVQHLKQKRSTLQCYHGIFLSIKCSHINTTINCNSLCYLIKYNFKILRRTQLQ